MEITTNVTLEELSEWIVGSLKTEEEIEPGTFALSDVAEVLNISKDAARRRIDKMLRLGIIEPCMVNRANRHGIVHPRPSYRIIRE